MRGTSVMNPADIKNLWSSNAAAAARAGTWMHLQCECVLNGGFIDGACPEMTLLQQFLGNTKPLLAFRTEWCVWAEEEKLAGCIDFVGIDEKGHLV